MTETIRYWFTGQAGLEIDCGVHKKTRVVFAMIDVDKTSIGWYLFASKADAKTQKECEAAKDPGADKFGYRRDIGRLIPHTFQKKIAINELASDKGTPATLSIEVESEDARLMGFRIDKLKTKAGEIVTFPFGMQRDSTPSGAGKDIEGKVFFLETAAFDEDKFPQGPQGKDSQIKITGKVL